MMEFHRRQFYRQDEISKFCGQNSVASAWCAGKFDKHLILFYYVLYEKEYVLCN